MNPTYQPVGFRQLFDYNTWTYTYLLWDLDTREGVLIDPVREQFERDHRVISELGVHLKYALDTHVHADHVTSLGLFREAMGVETAVGEPSGVPCADILLKDSDKLTFGKHTIQALPTPGHTDACTSFHCENMLFTGDTLFIRGCGRTDFQQGSPKKLFESIQKLYSFPDDTLIYPGHDYKGECVSSVGEEKQFNPRIPALQTEAGFTEIMNALRLPKPKFIDEAVPANLGCGVSRDVGHHTEELFSVHNLERIHDRLPEDEMIIDCRTPEEYLSGHVPGAVNIPMGEELNHSNSIRQARKAYIYCRSGRRAQSVYATLSNKGLENLVCINSSGMLDWEMARYPLEK